MATVAHPLPHVDSESLGCDWFTPIVSGSAPLSAIQKLKTQKCDFDAKLDHTQWENNLRCLGTLGQHIDPCASVARCDGAYAEDVSETVPGSD